MLSAVPADRRHPVSITDWYIAGTRLRLRRMQTETEVVYKTRWYTVAAQRAMAVDEFGGPSSG